MALAERKCVTGGGIGVALAGAGVVVARKRCGISEGPGWY